MKIQGRDCTLTLAKDDEYYPLPYSEETVRQRSKGYFLPAVIGKRNREKFVATRQVIEGCFVTRLDYSCILALFLLLFKNDIESFDLYADRIFEKIIYKNIKVKNFELRAENGEAFKLRVDVESTEDSYTKDWPINTPDLRWIASGSALAMTGSINGGFDRLNHRTYYYDGHLITINNNKTIPLIYRFELTGTYTETSKYKLTLYFPLSTEFFPSKNPIEKLTIPIDIKDGIWLDLYDLEAAGELVDINCADTVLASQSFRVKSNVVFNIRNEKDFYQIVL